MYSLKALSETIRFVEKVVDDVFLFLVEAPFSSTLGALRVFLVVWFNILVALRTPLFERDVECE